MSELEAMETEQVEESVDDIPLFVEDEDDFNESYENNVDEVEDDVEEVEEDDESPEQTQEPSPTERLQADLERRDKELIGQKAYLKAQEKQLKRFEELQDLAKTDALAAARAMGIDPIQLAERYLAGEDAVDLHEPAPEQSALAQEVEQLKQYIQQKEQKAAVEAEMTRIRSELGAGSEKRPYLTMLSKENDEVATNVYNVIATHYQETDELLEVNDVLDRMENHYSKSFDKSLGSLVANPMMRARLEALLTGEKATAPKPKQAKQRVTLNNNMSSEPNTDVQDLDEDESDELFMEIIRNGLPQGD